MTPNPPGGSRCPACQADLRAGAVLCVECGFDRRTGRKRATAAPAPSRPATPRWFCRIDEVEHGPLASQDIARMARAGRLKATDLVRGPGQAEWVAAGKVKGLSFAAPTAPGRTYRWQPAVDEAGLRRAYRAWVAGCYVIPAACALAILAVALVFFSGPVGGDPAAERNRQFWVDINRGIGFAGAACWVFGAVAFWVLVHRMWQQVQDGHAYTTPGRAVGFCFIPVYNLYWVFVGLGELPRSLNDFAARHAVPAPPASTRLMHLYCLMAAGSVIPVVALVFVVPALVVIFLAVRSAKTTAVAIAEVRERLQETDA